jgi:hypothetical protein
MTDARARRLFDLEEPLLPMLACLRLEDGQPAADPGFDSAARALREALLGWWPEMQPTTAEVYDDRFAPVLARMDAVPRERDAQASVFLRVRLLQLALFFARRIERRAHPGRPDLANDMADVGATRFAEALDDARTALTADEAVRLDSWLDAASERDAGDWEAAKAELFGVG